MTDKLPFLPDKHHYAIAHVATRAAQLDHMIEATIAHLLAHSPRTARFLLHGLSGDRPLQLLQWLLIDRCPDQEIAITELTAKIKAMRDERNEILHWLWGKADSPQTASLATIRPFRTHQTKNKTAEEMSRLAQEMLDAVVKLADWKIPTLLPAPSRDTLGLQTPPEHSASPSDEGLTDNLGLLGRLQPPSQE